MRRLVALFVFGSFLLAPAMADAGWFRKRCYKRCYKPRRCYKVYYHCKPCYPKHYYKHKHHDADPQPVPVDPKNS